MHIYRIFEISSIYIKKKSKFPSKTKKNIKLSFMSEKIFSLELETTRNPPTNPAPKVENKKFLNFFRNHKKSFCFFSFLFLLLVIIIPLALYYIITSINKERYYTKNINFNTGSQNVSIDLTAFYNGTSPFQDFLFINVTHSFNGSITKCENIIIKDKFNESVSTMFRCGNDSDFKLLNDSLINTSKMATFGIFASDETNLSSEKNRILHGHEPKQPGNSYDNTKNNGGSSGCTTLSGYGNFQYDSCSGDASVNGKAVNAQTKGSCSCKCTQITGNGAYSYTICN